jgi:SET domain-containing protein
MPSYHYRIIKTVSFLQKKNTIKYYFPKRYQNSGNLEKVTTQKKVTSTYTLKDTKEFTKYTKNREGTQYLFGTSFYHTIPFLQSAY